MPRSEKRVATTAADPVCSLGRACAIGRGSGGVAPVLADRHRSGLDWRSEPGCLRWCRGARPRTATSPTRSSTGTSVSPRGRPGAIVVEATGIRDVPSGPLLRIGHDRFLPGLRRLVETVRRASEGRTRLLIQLIDFLTIRRRPEPKKFFERFLAVTDRHRARAGRAGAAGRRGPRPPERHARRRACARPYPGASSKRSSSAIASASPTRSTAAHPRACRDVLPTLFADAAARAEQAGFDGVELHYAHAYTMASFLSRTNTRADGYGGSRENRVRLPLEVFAAVRAAGRQGICGRLPLPRRRMHRGRQRCR